MREVGPALSKLISLDVQLQDTRSCLQTAALLDNALLILASACPTLTSFHIKGPLPTAFLSSLGQQCPLLTTLTVMCPDPCDAPFLTGLLLQQPSLLPHVTNLDLYDCTDGYELTGLSANKGILSLYMQCWHFRSQEQWLSLPPKLQHLRFMYMDEGPPPTFADGSPVLGSLLSIEMEEWPPTLCLHAFTQILRAAPTFHHVKVLRELGERSSVIQCNMADSKVASIPADLALLLEKQKSLPSIKDATYCIDGTVRGDGQSIVSVIAELPLMFGVARFEFHGLETGELGHLLRATPDLQDLELNFCNELEDIELQDLGVCAQLHTLTIIYNHNVTPLGLFALCQSLPKLKRVICRDCQLLNATALQACTDMLHRHGSLVDLVGNH